ncbi:MAG TPA: PAS domain-containing protein [Bryobacteraceae bacterium]|nr:PAS domain-containing protein [Bryobacteraceae bacterium]
MTLLFQTLLVVLIVAAIALVFVAVDALIRRWRSQGLSLERLRLLFSGRPLYQVLPDAVVGVDQRGLIRSLNEAAERMFGYEEAETLGQPISGLLRGAVACGGSPKGAATPIPLASGSMETQAVRKNGSRFPAVCIPLRSVLPGRSFVLVEDVSERDETDQYRWRSELLTKAIKTVETPLVVLDGAGRVVIFNRACEGVFGPPLVEGRHLADLGIVADGEVFEHPSGYVFNVKAARGGLAADHLILVGTRKNGLARAGNTEHVARLEDLLTEMNGYAELLLCGLEADSPYREDIEHLSSVSNEAIAVLKQVVARKDRAHQARA